MRSQHWKLIATVCIGLALLAVYFVSRDTTPIRVGFSGQLEGKYSDLGILGRNGVQLCMEQINANGGIKGRQLELVTRNDGNTDADAITADSELENAGVVAIIGHMTSQQSLAAMKAAATSGAGKIVYISPTTSTPILSGIRDNFFRVMAANTSWANSLAEHAFSQSQSRRFAAIYDTDNESYTKTFCDSFTERFTSLGGHIVASIPVQSSSLTNWDSTVAAMRDAKADGVVLGLSARDTISLAQALYLQNMQLPLFSSPWAITNDLIIGGGKHLEGMIACITYNPDSTRPEFLLFKQQYSQRFGAAPTFAAAFGYEAMQTLAAALQKTDGNPEGLASALTTLGSQKGVVGQFEIDEFGDSQRRAFILTITNGTIVNVE